MISKRIENLTQDLLDSFNANTIPVNIVDIVEKHGIEIIEDDLGENVTGLLAIDGEKSIIGVSKIENSNKNRERFTIAHEFGHYILHKDQSNFFVDSNFKIMFRDQTSSQGIDINEIQANAFAAAILMPRSLLITKIKELNLDLSEDDTIKKIAEEFGVSITAMSYRISNLGIV